MSLISLINRIPFGNSAEKGFFLYKNVPPKFLQGMEVANFIKTIRFVAEHSPFYRRKFKEHGIVAANVRSPKDLGDFFTSPEDLRANPQELVCLKPDTAYETTGTTSKKPKRVYFSRQEVEEAGWAGAVGLWGVGVRPEDRVVSAFDYSFWVSGPVLQASCKVLGAFHVEAGRMNPEEFYDRLKDYGITVIVGDPSWLLRLSEVAKDKGPWPIKLMIGGGENFTEEARRFCESVWKADFLLSYGQTEAFGAIGMESLAKDGYHLNEFHNYFEIIPRDAEPFGELVYTTLNRRVMPLVRYRSGDITRFIDTPAPGGLPGRRIEKLKGRLDEWVPTAMGNIAPWMFEEVLAEIPGLSADWQIALEKKDRKDLIVIHVEALKPDLSLAAAKEAVFSRLKSRLEEAWQAYERQCFEFEVMLHPKGVLRQGRKLRRIVDQRKF